MKISRSKKTVIPIDILGLPNGAYDRKVILKGANNLWRKQRLEQFFNDLVEQDMMPEESDYQVKLLRLLLKHRITAEDIAFIDEEYSDSDEASVAAKAIISLLSFGEKVIDTIYSCSETYGEAMGIKINRTTEDVDFKYFIEGDE